MGNRMRVCDYIARELSNIGVKNIYGLMGGGAAGLNDGFIKNPDLNYICFHNEQGAGHAAIGESKATGKLAVVNPTTGCGGTNCITSVLDAWQDSVPILFISGNVGSKDMTYFYNENREHEYHLRKYGIQENDISTIVEPITKRVWVIEDVDYVALILRSAIQEATSGRPGPVWIDIPSNIQTAEMPEYVNVENSKPMIDFDLLKTNTLPQSFVKNLMNYKRPIILAGAGIRQANCISEFLMFVGHTQIPYVSTYAARDYAPYHNVYNIGAIGVKGSRQGNFAMYHSDLLLILGCSLNTSHIGYDERKFSPYSHKIRIDIDRGEIHRNYPKIDETYRLHLKNFFLECRKQMENTK